MPKMLTLTLISPALFIMTGLTHSFLIRNIPNPILEVLMQKMLILIQILRVSSIMIGLTLCSKRMNTHNLTSEDQSHTMHMMTQHSPATSTMTGLMFKPVSILNQISEELMLKMLIQIPTSQASFITIGPIHNYQRMSTHSQTSEDQFHTMLMTTPHSPATSTMTGLMCKLIKMSTHNQILEGQSHIMLTTIPHSPATSTMTGLMFKLMSILNQILEVLMPKMLIRTQISQASFITIGLIHNFQRMSILNQISEDQFHIMLMMIQHSPAISTMTGHMFKPMSIHNQTSEASMPKMPIQIQTLQASFIMTGLMHKQMMKRIVMMIKIPLPLYKLQKIKLIISYLILTVLTQMVDTLDKCQKDSPKKEMTGS